MSMNRGVPQLNTAENTAEQLAYLLAARRTGRSLRMGGESNPTAGEIASASRFVRDMLAAGWTLPPQEEGPPGFFIDDHDRAVIGLIDYADEVQRRINPGES